MALLEDLGAAFAGYQARVRNAYVRTVHLQLGGVTHSSAVTACTLQGGQLCHTHDICPGGDISGGPALSALVGEHWAPVGDKADDWVQIGSAGAPTCDNWLSKARLAADSSTKGHVYCCRLGTPLDVISGDDGFSSVVSAAVSEMAGIQQNATQYANKANASTLASALPTTLKAIRATLEELSRTVSNDAETLTSMYNNMQIHYSVRVGQINSNTTSLQDEATTARKTNETATASANSQLATEQDLVKQRETAQTECEATPTNAPAPA